MLVLVSFVLVLVAAVTLVVGLLQSGLTLIYLSIASSVLAGVVLAVAVLRGRPEPKPAAAPRGRAFTPPAAETTAQVPAGVGASSSSAATTSSWAAPTTSAPSDAAPTPSPPPPRPSSPTSSSASTEAAGAALLGRLRRRSSEAAKTDGDTDQGSGELTATEGTSEIPVARPDLDEDDDGFPVANYEKLRATELMALLPDLDRNQLEAVRQRESAGKNRFTIMSRIDSLLAAETPGAPAAGVEAPAEAEPAWEVADDEWDDVSDEPVEVEVVEMVELDEADDDAEPAITGGSFPIAGYDTLTVGQILPRLGELSPSELAAVREREAAGRRRGTVLDRIDRLTARSGPAPMAMPPATPPSRPGRAKKAPATQEIPIPAPAKAPARKARGGSTTSSSPVAAMKEAVAKAAAKTAEKTSAAKEAVAKKTSKRGGGDDDTRLLTKAPGSRVQAAKAAKTAKAAKEAASTTRTLTKAPGAKKAAAAKKASRSTKK